MKKQMSLAVIGSIVLASSASAAEPVAKTERKASRKPNQIINRVSSEIPESRMQSAPSRSSLGFQAGASISSWSSSKSEDASHMKSLTGAMVGVNFQHHFTREFAVRPEVNYVNAGTTITNTLVSKSTGEAVDLRMNLHMIEVPLYLKAIYSRAAFKPFIMAGPSAGFVFHKNVTANVPGDKTYSSNADELKDMFSSVLFGANVAAGGEFNLANDTLFMLSGRYHHGMSNVLSKSYVKSSGGDYTVHQRGLQFLGGVQFRL